MKVAINALSAKTGGGITFLKHLIPKLAEKEDNIIYFIIIRKDMKEFFRENIKSRNNINFIEIYTPNLIVRLLSEQLIVPYILWKRKIDIIYCPANISIFLSRCKVLLMIQSINPFININRQSDYQRIRLLMLKILSFLSIKKAHKTIFLSNFSRELVSTIFNLDIKKTEVIYLGVDFKKFYGNQKINTSKDPLLFYRIKGEYILSVSNISYYKNYEPLIIAYSNLNKRLIKRFQLVIAGRVIQKDYFLKISNLVENLNLKQKVTFLGEVNFEALPYLYRGASLFVLPSLIENFTFTVLEAMSSKVPIIASNATALLEEIEEAGLLFEPNDSKDLCMKIEKILSDTKLRGKLIKKGIERAKQFSWDICSEKTLKTINESYFIQHKEII